MAASSSLLGSGNVLAGPTKTRTSDREPISMVPVRSLPPPSSTRMKAEGIKAAATAIRAPIASSASSLDQSAAAAAMAVFDCKRIEEEEERRKKDSVSAEQMDRWLTESIGEIVRNIGEAPFLVQIFSQGPSVVRVEKEEASPERWPLVKSKWNQSNCTPDGVILVEQLKAQAEAADVGDNDIDDDSRSRSQRWGLVVQGRGMECAASCYILNTCRVRSSAGFCTHFCLVRAKCFGEAFDKQLGRAWLAGR